MKTFSLLEIKKLSNFELYQVLKQHNLHVGPVEKSTRSLYENRLYKNLMNDKRSQILLNSSSKHLIQIFSFLV